MFIKDGIVYAGEPGAPVPCISVNSVVAIEPYKLRVCFSNGLEKIYDAEGLLEYPVFQPLKDVEIFNSVSVHYGAPSWLNGEIDIDPESIYEQRA